MLLALRGVEEGKISALSNWNQDPTDPIPSVGWVCTEYIPYYEQTSEVRNRLRTDWISDSLTYGIGSGPHYLQE